MVIQQERNVHRLMKAGEVDSLFDGLQELFCEIHCSPEVALFWARKWNGGIPVMRDSMQNVCECAQADQVEIGLIRCVQKNNQSVCFFTLSARVLALWE